MGTTPKRQRVVPPSVKRAGRRRPTKMLETAALLLAGMFCAFATASIVAACFNLYLMEGVRAAGQAMHDEVMTLGFRVSNVERRLTDLEKRR